MKNKQYYVPNLRVKTRTERDITKFQDFNNFIKKQSDLCRNATRPDAKIPPLFDAIWEMRMNIYIADTLIGVAPSYYINLWVMLPKYYKAHYF